MDSNNYKELFDMLDVRYVRKDDCSARHERTEDEINEIKINQAKNTTQLSLIIKIGACILTAVVGLLATQIGSMIFK